MSMHSVLADIYIAPYTLHKPYEGTSRRSLSGLGGAFTRNLGPAGGRWCVYYPSWVGSHWRCCPRVKQG